MKKPFLLTILFLTIFVFRLSSQESNRNIAGGTSLTVVVKSVNIKAKTMILILDGKEVQASAPKLKKWPKEGDQIILSANNANQRPWVYDNCEKCNAECPGVCFMNSDLRCRCYLLHL